MRAVEKGAEAFHDPRLSPQQNKAVEMLRNGFAYPEVADELDIDARHLNSVLSQARRRAPDLSLPLKERSSTIRDEVARLSAPQRDGSRLSNGDILDRLRVQGYDTTLGSLKVLRSRLKASGADIVDGRPLGSGGVRVKGGLLGLGALGIAAANSNDQAEAAPLNKVPNMWFHGTSANVAGDLKAMGRFGDHNSLGPGLYVTKDPKMAGMYAEPDEGVGGALFPVRARGKYAPLPTFTNLYNGFKQMGQAHPDALKATHDKLRAAGFAGIEDAERGDRLIFDPTKSVRPAFTPPKPAPPRMRYELGGSMLGETLAVPATRQSIMDAFKVTDEPRLFKTDDGRKMLVVPEHPAKQAPDGGKLNVVSEGSVSDPLEIASALKRLAVPGALGFGAASLAATPQDAEAAPLPFKTLPNGVRFFDVGRGLDNIGQAGRIEAKEMKDGLHIVSSDIPDFARGKGLGIDMYRTLIEDAAKNDLPAIYSDNRLSPFSQRIYPALARRGYDVKPSARESYFSAGDWQYSGNNNPLFRVRARPYYLAGAAGAAALMSGQSDDANAAPLGKLPMDVTSRLERAKAQGFDVATPLYHGTRGDFGEFAGPTYLTGEPSRANIFAYGEQGNVRPSYVRLQNPLRVPGWDGEMEGFGKSSQKLDELKRQGYDGVIQGNNEQVLVFDPKNIRSRFAAFDPAKKNSNNILAGTAAVTGVGASAYGANQNQANAAPYGSWAAEEARLAAREAVRRNPTIAYQRPTVGALGAGGELFRKSTPGTWDELTSVPDGMHQDFLGPAAKAMLPAAAVTGGVMASPVAKNAIANLQQDGRERGWESYAARRTQDLFAGLPPPVQHEPLSVGQALRNLQDIPAQPTASLLGGQKDHSRTSQLDRNPFYVAPPRDQRDWLSRSVDDFKEDFKKDPVGGFLNAASAIPIVDEVAGLPALAYSAFSDLFRGNAKPLGMSELTQLKARYDTADKRKAASDIGFYLAQGAGPPRLLPPP